MAVMRETCSEWGPIVESVGLLAFRPSHLLVEGVDLLPVLEDFLFLLRKIWPFRHCKRYDVKSQLREII